jgi:putative acetyltransferase
VKYIIATSVQEYEEAKKLFTEYATWLNIDLCFQNFAKELDEIEKMYAADSGGIFLCFDADKYIGCSAIRRIDDMSCELKRMWVQQNYQGKGIGEELLKKCIELAKQLNYKTIRLDTLSRLQPAIQLYKKYGFEETSSYYNNPNPDVVYMKKELY